MPRLVMAERLFNPYCSVEEVRGELRNSDPAASLDDVIIRAINAASRFIDQYTRRDFFLHDYSVTPLVIDQYSRNVFGDQIYLPYSPVIGTMVVEEGTATLVADVDYLLRGIVLIRTSDGSLFTGAYGPRWGVGVAPYVVKLTGKFGYNQVPGVGEVLTEIVPEGIPGNIRQAAILISASLTGHNQKEVVSLEGSKQSIVDREIPGPAYALLGSRGILI